MTGEGLIQAEAEKWYPFEDECKDFNKRQQCKRIGYIAGRKYSNDVIFRQTEIIANLEEKLSKLSSQEAKEIAEKAIEFAHKIAVMVTHGWSEDQHELWKEKIAEYLSQFDAGEKND